MKIKFSKSALLNNIASMYGVKRRLFESSKRFRVRIQKTIQDLTYGSCKNREV